MNDNGHAIFSELYSILESHNFTREHLFTTVDELLKSNCSKEVVVTLVNLVILYSSLYKKTEKHLKIAENEILKHCSN